MTEAEMEQRRLSSGDGDLLKWMEIQQKEQTNQLEQSKRSQGSSS
jgi:hypothetical protein